MDISKAEQRIMHVLAQGGHICLEKDERGKIIEVNCVTRDGWFMSGMNLLLFRKLKAKRLIKSQGGKPYRATRLGLTRVRAELDNR
ncbi:YjhX family toxin [Pseudovibrio exalbescens]|uniref:YjhX family toxin n=1 Tax=Pseudovibrio exalbescens TaxID=197461 RepID=UPI0023652EF9|nr:YjhX family toxin [Pseudovibrio exalbescens]MDD7910716.1 YjhX family toxin [Pseudovibrio exalbescens]